MRKILFIVVLSTLLWLPRIVYAEFSCSADIRFKWRSVSFQKTNAPGAQNASVGAPTPAGTNDAAPADAAAEAKTDVHDVFWMSLESKGASEDEAKAKLKVLINDQRAKADSACREAHENQSNCLANKYSQYASLQGALTFSQKKDLERKIVEDCEMAAGQCLGSAATEPLCKEIVAAAGDAAAADATKGKEKEKGAKKK